MLKIENLHKTYGKLTALDGLNLEVARGELYGFVGPNGAGKTTTLRIISGLLNADRGNVWVNGIGAGKNPSELKATIGFVPDFFGIYENLMVDEYLEFFAAAYGIFGKEGRKRADEVLELVGLTEQKKMAVDGLSRGMQQRLCLARAIVHRPKLLVLDEPGSGLDPRTRKDFQSLLQRLCQEGYTILISSHILSELADMCTAIGIIDKGKLVMQGKMDEIMLSIDSSNPLLITVYNRLERAVEVLRRSPLVSRMSIDKNKIAVYFTGSREEEGYLLRELVEADVLVMSFVREQSTLESLFFRLTESGKEDCIFESESGI